MKIKQFIKAQIQEETHDDKVHLMSLEQKILTQTEKIRFDHAPKRTHRFTSMYMLRFAATAMVAIIVLFAGVTLLPQSNNPILQKVQNKVGIKQVSAEELVRAVQEAIDLARLHYVEVHVTPDGKEEDGVEIWVDRKERKVRRVMPSKDGNGQYVDIGYLWGSTSPRSFVFTADQDTKEGLFIESQGIPAIEVLIENDFEEALKNGFIKDATVDIISYQGKDVYKLAMKSAEGKTWRIVYIDPVTHLPLLSEGYTDAGELGGTSKFLYKEQEFSDDIFSVSTPPAGYTLMPEAKVTEFSLFPNGMDIPNVGEKTLKYGYQIRVSNGRSTITLADGFPAGFSQKFYVSTDAYGSVEKATEATEIVWEPLVYEKPSYSLPYFHTTQNGTGAHARFKLTVLDNDGNVVYELDRIAPLAELTSEEKFNGPQNLPEYFTFFTPVEHD